VITDPFAPVEEAGVPAHPIPGAIHEDELTGPDAEKASKPGENLPPIPSEPTKPL
jgi:hypothetical protein